jgi:hypothetical protein
MRYRFIAAALRSKTRLSPRYKAVPRRLVTALQTRLGKKPEDPRKNPFRLKINPRRTVMRPQLRMNARRSFLLD